MEWKEIEKKIGGKNGIEGLRCDENEMKSEELIDRMLGEEIVGFKKCKMIRCKNRIWKKVKDGRMKEGRKKGNWKDNEIEKDEIENVMNKGIERMKIREKKLVDEERNEIEIEGKGKGLGKIEEIKRMEFCLEEEDKRKEGRKEWNIGKEVEEEIIMEENDRREKEECIRKKGMKGNLKLRIGERIGRRGVKIGWERGKMSNEDELGIGWLRNVFWEKKMKGIEKMEEDLWKNEEEIEEMIREFKKELKGEEMEKIGM